MGVIQIFINKNGKYLGASSSSYVWDDPDDPKQVSLLLLAVLLHSNLALLSLSQLSIYVQLPVFVLSGVAEVVGNIATLELAYVGSPPSMKSLVMAFALMTRYLLSGFSTDSSSSFPHDKY